MSGLEGLLAIIPTPAHDHAAQWDAQSTVDLDELERLVTALLADGVHGLVALGTTGECATLTRKEWDQTVDCMLVDMRRHRSRSSPRDHRGDPAPGLGSRRGDPSRLGLGGRADTSNHRRPGGLRPVQHPGRKGPHAAGEYCRPGPVRPPYDELPDDYDTAATECGRRWHDVQIAYTSSAKN